ncbi:36252_t:CDS:1, partial [Racocetra persica]
LQLVFSVEYNGRKRSSAYTNFQFHFGIWSVHSDNCAVFIYSRLGQVQIKSI